MRCVHCVTARREERILFHYFEIVKNESDMETFIGKWCWIELPTERLLWRPTVFHFAVTENAERRKTKVIVELLRKYDPVLEALSRKPESSSIYSPSLQNVTINVSIGEIVKFNDLQEIRKAATFSWVIFLIPFEDFYKFVFIVMLTLSTIKKLNKFRKIFIGFEVIGWGGGSNGGSEMEQ